MTDQQVDVVVVGSGFGASVAALRFAESGKSVMILERGGWITRDNFEADDDMLWQPNNKRFGMNDFRTRGAHIIPWLGAGVGGGSHVYAATLKRRDFFDDFPGKLTVEQMAPYYYRAEQMMDAMKYPDHPPYSNLPAYELFRDAEKKMAQDFPDSIEKHGDILLGISFAPADKKPGKKFVNRHGASQRYSDPGEQKILGGDIDVKNTLDKNYLFVAQKHGAVITPFAEVTKIFTAEDGYRIEFVDPRTQDGKARYVKAKFVIVGAGSIGSTELLMKNKLEFNTLPNLSEKLGHGYYSNGDYVTFLVPKKGLLISWLGLLAGIIGCFIFQLWLIILGFSAYFVGWWLSDSKIKPDVGSTNSDYIRFKHRDGTTQGAYIEGGRYPTPIKAVTAIILSLLGQYNPETYIKINRRINFLYTYIPFIELIGRSWPVPILMMGRDDAYGTFNLNDDGEVEIDFKFDQNEEYIAYIEKWGKAFSKRAKSYFISNIIARYLKIVEVPHNLGGVPMGDTADDGVVDTYGRVYNYPNLMVLDGSIIPCSLGPNPANTILALAERAMEKVLDQVSETGEITAE